MSYREKLLADNIPQHVAVIMDGNGRWAKIRGNSRIFGHKNAIAAVNDTVEAAAELNIKYLTLFAFSTENWKRPKLEVEALMALLINTLNNELKKLLDNNIRLIVIGDRNALPKNVNTELDKTIKRTENHTGLTLIIALSYSGKWDILQAVKRISLEIKDKNLDISQIDDKFFANFLSTANIPDPELLIRTSAELRISNFFLWQLAYTELFFPKKLWPDFRKEDFFEAIFEFQQRNRRFGQVSE